MSTFLQRLGAFSARRRRSIAAFWVLLLVGLGIGMSIANATFTSSFSIPGSPSQKANDLLAERLPAAGGGSGRMVFAAPAGKELTAEQRTAIRATLADVSKGKDVAAASDPFTTKAVSKDGRIAFSQITFKVPSGDITKSDQEAVNEAGAAATAAGVQVATSGDAAEQGESAGAAEAIGIVIAFLILTITFGSLLAAGMPLVTALVGVGVGMTGVSVIAAFTELSSSVTALATMLGLAVGIDYALFILSRHRRQAQEGMDLNASIAHAAGTAGSAVVFAGSTVVIALVALAVTGVPFLTAMGLAAAGTVAVAVLINLTLVPALLAFAGPRAVKGKATLAGDDGSGKDTMGGRWVKLVDRHRVPAMLLAIVVPLAIAIPALDLRLGLPDDSTAPAHSSKREAYELLKTGFGPGFSGPLTVIADVPEGGDSAKAAATLRAKVTALPDVTSVSPASFSPDKSIALLQVTPTSGPSTPATEDLVHSIRGLDAPVRQQTGASVLVTGQTATNIDVSKRMSDSLVPYLAVVVGLALLLLMLAFRSILIPVTAIAGFLLSIAASLGAMTAIFQQGFLSSVFGVPAGAPVVSLIPILMIGILFGLAMDYQVFLVSAMREARTHGAAARDAVTHGFRSSARVVTAAALIMISVFAGFMLTDDAVIKSIGFALAFGILIDAFIVRMTLIPALMSLLGERAWWLPKWLGRVLPDVDIEGAKLEEPARDSS